MYIGKNSIVVNIQTRLYIETRKKIDIFSVVYLFYIICIIPFHRRFNIKKIILISLFFVRYICVLLTSLYYISFQDGRRRQLLTMKEKHSRASLSSSSFVSFPSMPRNCFPSSLFAMPRVCVF